LTQVLEVKAIDTFRGPAHILHGVSLSVGAQEVVCLVGRNGAGKTTTIESIMGFLPVRAGEIVFGGENLNRLPPHQRARRGIGYSPEDCGVFPELSVGENLMIGRWLGEEVVRKRGGTHADPEEQAFAVFPEVKNLLARQGLHLSGGQRKMVAVARAMMLSPTLLLLDEAFEGLAPVGYEKLVTELHLTAPLDACRLLTTAKRMFARNLRAVAGEYAGHDGQADAEIEELKEILMGSAQSGRRLRT